MNPTLKTLLLGAGFGATFLVGQRFAPTALQAQGRGAVNPPPPTEPVPGTPTTGGETEAAAPVVFPGDSGQSSASANGFLAVTGSYGIGTSVLYLVDTQNRQLAVYEARGGSAEQRRIVLVGARRIDLDLQLPSYNDRSEYEYDDLQRLFEKRGTKDRSVRTGLERDK